MPTTVAAADVRTQLNRFAALHPEMKSGNALSAGLVGEATRFVNEALGAPPGTAVTADVVRGQLEEILARQADRGTAGLSSIGGPAGSTVGAGRAGAPRNARGTPAHPALFGATADVAAQGIAAAQKLKDPAVVQIFTEPSSRTSTTVRFEVGGRELKPGEKLLFQIPPDLRGAAIRTAIVVHRKDEKYAGSVDASGRDQQGAYHLVTARKTGSDDWVTWSDHFGTAKFVEPRPAHDPENENLHDWLQAVGKTPVDLMQITATGKGPLAIGTVYRVEIEFFPPGKVALAQEEIFTPGTKFVDPEHNVLAPVYGGGQGSRLSAEDLRTKGLYPGAREIGGYGAAAGAATDNSYLDPQGNLHVKLPAGKILGSLEVAVGDTGFDKNRPADQQRNKDGHYGSLGWAKLSAHIRNPQDNGGTPNTLFSNTNVPPSGVISGGPLQSGYVTRPGDEIVIEARGHKASVMGYRVHFMAPENNG